MPCHTIASTLVGSSLYGFDAVGLVTSITHKDSSAATIDALTYVYDDANRVTSETSSAGATLTITYDKSGQLTGDGVGTYDYDLNGNRTMSGYSTGTANQLSSDGTYDFTYDDEGNLTEKENSTTTETWLYGYNHLNQLTQIQHKSTSAGSVDKQVDFTYDVFGNRTERSYDADGAGAGTATVEKFAYDLMGNAWADLDSGGSLTTRRLYERAIDALFARIDSGGADWYLTDRLGSVRDIMNNSSSSIYNADYDGYGNITSETNPPNGDRYKYTSREWEAEFNLQYNRARYYDPSIGRWISQDPIGFNAGDSNLYRYVNNKPTMATDPSGHQQAHLSHRYSASKPATRPTGWSKMWEQYLLEKGKSLGKTVETQTKMDLKNGNAYAGLEISHHLKKAVSLLQTTFNNLSDKEKENLGRQINTVSGWDIYPLAFLKNISKDVNPLISGKYGKGVFNEFVTVNGETHFGGAVNYWLWGRVNRMLFEWEINRETFKNKMKTHLASRLQQQVESVGVRGDGSIYGVRKDNTFVDLPPIPVAKFTLENAISKVTMFRWFSYTFFGSKQLGITERVAWIKAGWFNDFSYASALKLNDLIKPSDLEHKGSFPMHAGPIYVNAN